MLTTLLVAASVASPLTVGEPVPVNRGAFGINNNNATAADRPADPAYRALIDKLGATRARYLGGSSASFWDWRTGKYVAPDEITRIWPAEHGNWMLPLVEDVARLPDGQLGPVAYARFADAAGVEVQWMTNLTTRADDQPAMFETLREAGIDVTLVELDNETYFWGAEFGGGEDRAVNYADRASTLSRAVRALYPDARIGVVAAESGLFVDDMHDSSETHYDVWNDVLGRDAYAGDFDAFILHHYVMRHGTLDGVPEDQRGTAFLTTPQVTLERAADKLATGHGGVPMWITEFNVIGYYTIGERGEGGSDADDWIMATRHSAWNALYQAGFWLTALQRPGAIETLNHHSVDNVSLGWGLGLPVSETEADLTATGQVFAHLATLAADAKTAAPVAAGPEVVGFEGVAIQAVQGVRFDTGVTILLNRAAAPVTVEGVNGTAVIYAAGDPVEASVRVSFDEPLWAQGPLTPEQAEADGSLALPPHSLALVAR